MESTLTCANILIEKKNQEKTKQNKTKQNKIQRQTWVSVGAFVNQIFEPTLIFLLNPRSKRSATPKISANMKEILWRFVTPGKAFNTPRQLLTYLKNDIYNMCHLIIIVLFFPHFFATPYWNIHRYSHFYLLRVDKGARSDPMSAKTSAIMTSFHFIASEPSKTALAIANTLTNMTFS